MTKQPKQTIRINQKRIYDEAGSTKRVPAREIIEAVTMRYKGGKVMGQSGDVWSVVADPEARATFLAVC